jgi:diphthine-ammonia ligase
MSVKHVAISWSSGKDSCLALHIANQDGLSPVVLLCMMDLERDYARSNGASKQVLELQAKSLNLPIYFVKTSWEYYEDNLVKALLYLKDEYQIEGCVFGDIDIENHRIFEESVCSKVGITAYLPLWGMMRNEVKNRIICLDIKSKLSVINKAYPITHLIDNDYSEIDFTELIKLGVDICGENGEFHTIVYDAPLFKFSIKLEQKIIHDLGHFLLCDFAGYRLPEKVVE